MKINLSKFFLIINMLILSITGISCSNNQDSSLNSQQASEEMSNSLSDDLQTSVATDFKISSTRKLDMASKGSYFAFSIIVQFHHSYAESGFIARDDISFTYNQDEIEIQPYDETKTYSNSFTYTIKSKVNKVITLKTKIQEIEKEQLFDFSAPLCEYTLLLSREGGFKKNDSTTLTITSLEEYNQFLKENDMNLIKKNINEEYFKSKKIIAVEFGRTYGTSSVELNCVYQTNNHLFIEFVSIHPSSTSWWLYQGYSYFIEIDANVTFLDIEVSSINLMESF